MRRIRRMRKMKTMRRMIIGYEKERKDMYRIRRIWEV